MTTHAPLLVPKDLPPLTPEASACGAEMVMLLRERITGAGGTISFADYMDTALYAPGLGYYSGGLHKIGKTGDFVTAPEISPLFGRCLARQVAELLAMLKNGAILEVGAGSGILAVELLTALDEWQIPLRCYSILELSAELRARQKETLATRLPHWLPRVEWRTDLPEPGWEGVVVANEFLDALPVHRFILTEQGIMEQRVGWEAIGFAWQLAPPTGYLASALHTWYDVYSKDLAIGYISELALAAPAWLATVAERVHRGGILLVDYGYGAREYYHPERYHGTLACHYHHRRHHDPLILPGLQDITAHVNFTALADAAVIAGLTVAGYTTQANFLIATGIGELFTQLTSNDAAVQLSLANQMRYLTFPQEMGEIFKILAITKGVPGHLMGFRTYDLRTRL